MENLLKADGGLVKRNARFVLPLSRWVSRTTTIKAYLIQEKLTYAKVLEEASRKYKNLVDSKA